MLQKLLRARTAATVVVALMVLSGIAVAATTSDSRPTLASEESSTSLGVGDSTTTSAVDSSSTSTSVDDSSTTSSTVGTDVTSTTSAPSTSTTTGTGTGSGGEFKNHGECVSAAAHDTPPGPGHGQAVSDVAKSDCGKASTDDTEGPESEGSSHGNGHGNSNGHGHSGS